MKNILQYIFTCKNYLEIHFSILLKDFDLSSISSNLCMRTISN